MDPPLFQCCGDVLNNARLMDSENFSHFGILNLGGWVEPIGYGSRLVVTGISNTYSTCLGYY